MNAYAQGLNDFAEGKYSFDNPYKYNTQRWHDWKMGYLKASRAVSAQEY